MSKLTRKDVENFPSKWQKKNDCIYREFATKYGKYMMRIYRDRSGTYYSGIYFQKNSVSIFFTHNHKSLPKLIVKLYDAIVKHHNEANPEHLLSFAKLADLANSYATKE